MHVLSRLPGWAVLTVGLWSHAAQAALQCPLPQNTAQPGVLRQTKVQIEEMTTFLAAGNPGDQAALIIRDLRQRYPRVQNAEVTNELMTAYCPLVVRLNGLSDAEQKARLDRFAGQVSQMLLDSPTAATPAAAK